MFLILLFVFAGIIGHDPWKADEAYVFGMVHHMHQTLDLVVPTLAGEPFMEKPPFYYWVATGFTYLLSGVLSEHDAARMASPFFMLIACWLVGAASRTWSGRGMGRFAALALIACFGTLEQSHLMMPDIPLLAAFAAAALGYAVILADPRKGGVLIGAGVGVAFMSKGLIGPGVMAITALALPALFRQWRQPAYWRGMGIAALVAAPFCLIWPLALYLRSPALFMEWFWVNNIGRFFGFSVQRLGTEHLPWFWTQTIPWYTFPALPLALLTVWRLRGQLFQDARLQYCLVAFGVLMSVLAVSSSGRCVYAWPLLIPLSILAAPAAVSLKESLDKLWAGVAMLLFGALSSVIWLGWTVMMFKGKAPEWPWLLRVLPADFVLQFSGMHALFALAVTIAGVAAWRGMAQHRAKGLTAWVVGVTMSWALLTTLWMPWLDYAKSYRSVFSAMPIPHAVNCLSSYNLGEGERAMLRYVTGFNPVRREVAPAANCKALLIQREVAYGEPDIDLTDWKEVWRGSRPGVTNERFWLFEFAPKAIASVNKAAAH